MSAPLPDGYTVRPARGEDLDPVCGLIDDADRALGLPLDYSREFLGWIWSLASIELARDSRTVWRGSEPVAFGQAIWHAEQGGPLSLIGRVHPDHQGRGIGAWIAAWGEELTRARAADGIRAEVLGLDERGHDLFRERGYAQVRSSFSMARPLGDADRDPGPEPVGVSIRGYERADERALYEVHEAAFADHWGFRPSSIEQFGDELGDDFDPSLAFLARAENRVVGLVVSYAFPDKGLVAILGVVGDHRRRGIGTALLLRSFAALATRGLPEVRLEVDAENRHGAVALYGSVGMSPLRRYDLFDLGTSGAA